MARGDATPPTYHRQVRMSLVRMIPSCPRGSHVCVSSSRICGSSTKVRAPIPTCHSTHQQDVSPVLLPSAVTGHDRRVRRRTESVERAFKDVTAAWKHAVNAVHIVIAEFLAPRFR
jgi:hypothetical protein